MIVNKDKNKKEYDHYITCLHYRQKTFLALVLHYDVHGNRPHLNTQWGNIRNVLWIGYNIRRLSRSVKVK
jgi:hypothetical protein